MIKNAGSQGRFYSFSNPQRVARCFSEPVIAVARLRIITFDGEIGEFVEQRNHNGYLPAEAPAPTKAMALPEDIDPLVFPERVRYPGSGETVPIRPSAASRTEGGRRYYFSASRPINRKGQVTNIRLLPS